MEEAKEHPKQHRTAKIIGACVFFIFLILGTWTLLSQKRVPSPTPNPADWIETDLTETVTIEDTSYIPINIAGDLDEKSYSALQVLQAFKKSHPQLEITSSQIVYLENLNNKPIVKGIWISHKLRCPCENQ